MEHRSSMASTPRVGAETAQSPLVWLEKDHGCVAMELQVVLKKRYELCTDEPSGVEVVRGRSQLRKQTDESFTKNE